MKKLDNSFNKFKTESGISQIFIIIIVALITSGLASAGVWYWQQQRIKDVEDSYKTQITKPKTTPTPSPSPSVTPSGAANCEVDLPILVFTPGGLFTEAEKNDIKNKVTEPYF
ncbi:MAG: hypothetical protein GTN40_05225, partial [Candidatus Aenigmarchaeota archaeon]|nr:hypothetical protein [Candidatus Aenigmarchaeota archaeon]